MKLGSLGGEQVRRAWYCLGRNLSAAIGDPGPMQMRIGFADSELP